MLSNSSSALKLLLYKIKIVKVKLVKYSFSQNKLQLNKKIINLSNGFFNLKLSQVYGIQTLLQIVQN